jgi:hypothetical protein
MSSALTTTFTDPFLHDDTEALNEVCYVEIPSNTNPSSGDEWGLGSLEREDEPTTLQGLSCMQIPERLFIDRAEGIEKTISPGLLISDPSGFVLPERVIQYNSTRYRVTNVMAHNIQDIVRVLMTAQG